LGKHTRRNEMLIVDTKTVEQFLDDLPIDTAVKIRVLRPFISEKLKNELLEIPIDDSWHSGHVFDITRHTIVFSDESLSDGFCDGFGESVMTLPWYMGKNIGLRKEDYHWIISDEKGDWIKIYIDIFEEMKNV
jgi:hypothetical protein